MRIKKIMGVLLSLAMLTTVADLSAFPRIDFGVTVSAAGTGTIEISNSNDWNRSNYNNYSTFRIKNKAAFEGFVDFINSLIYTYDFSDRTVILDENISYGSSGTLPNIKKTFKGTFDGNGHSITFEKIDAGLDLYVDKPLFNTLEGGTIKNLTVYVNRKLSTSFSGGILCNTVQKGGHVINCKVILSVAPSKTGGNSTSVSGLVGTLGTGSTIEKCTASLTVTKDDKISGEYKEFHINGICNESSGTISECTVSVKTYSKRDTINGAVGDNHGNLDDVNVDVDSNANQVYVCGTNDGTVQNCVAVGVTQATTNNNELPGCLVVTAQEAQKNKDTCPDHNVVIYRRIEPTCTQEGMEAGAKCTGTCKFKQGCDKIDKAPHDFVVDDTSYLAPTCANDGHEKNKVCSVCGFTKQGDTLKATQHSYTSTIIKTPTCTETGSELYTCSKCGHTYTETLSIVSTNHNLVQTPYQGESCTVAGTDAYWTCTYCKKLYEDKDGKADLKKPTTVEARKISPHAHTTEKFNVPITSCLGANANVEYWYCSECETYYNDQQGTNQSEINPTDNPGKHTLVQTVKPKAATCTEDGTHGYWTCKFCDIVFKNVKGDDGQILQTEGNKTTPADEVIAADGHKFNKSDALTRDKAATCTNAGTKGYWKCDNCDKYFKIVKDSNGQITQTREAETTTEAEVIPAAGHHCTNSDNKTAPKAATCTETGTYGYWKCDDCSTYFELKNDGSANLLQQTTIAAETIGALGHDLSVPTHRVEATCTENGNILYYPCQRSGCTQKFSDYEGTTAVTDTDIVIPAAHNLAKTEAQIATCSAPGHNAYWTCSKCNNLYKDDNGKVNLNQVTTADGEKITVAHTPEVIPAVDPTCEGTGLTAGEKCSVCQEILTPQTSVNALGHTPNDAVKENEVEPTCTVNGSHDEVVYCATCNSVITRTPVTDDALGHDWEVTGTITNDVTYCTVKKNKCKRCGREENSASLNDTHEVIEIEAKAATCTEMGHTEGKKCSKCQSYIEGHFPVDTVALGHDMGEFVEVEGSRVAATCNKSGQYTVKSVCQRDGCGHEETQIITIPAAHTNVVIDEAVVATCAETGLTEGSHCEDCKTVITPQTVTPKTEEHLTVMTNRREPTCTLDGNEDGSSCAICGTVFKEATVIKATGHVPVIVTKGKAPTCTEPGLTDSTKCYICGSLIDSQTAIPALGHVEVIERGTPPTCGTPGLTDGSHCSRCDSIVKVKEKIPATGLHVDKNRDNNCDVCGQLIPGSSTILGCTVTWDIDGILETEPYIVGSSASYKNDTPTKKGYVFTGWTPTPGAVYSDTTYRAVFEKAVLKAPENIKVDTKTGKVTWSPSACAVQYQIVKMVAPKTYYGVKTTGTSVKLTSVPKGTFGIAVIAFDADGNSVRSKTVTVNAPESGLGFASNVKVSDDGLVTWDKADNAVNYKICKTVNGKHYYGSVITDTKYKISGASNSAYVVRVIAMDGKGGKTWSAQVNVPRKTSGIVVNPELNGKKVTWKAVEGAKSYRAVKIEGTKKYYGKLTTGPAVKKSTVGKASGVTIASDNKTVSWKGTSDGVMYQAAKIIGTKTYYTAKTTGTSIKFSNAVKPGEMVYIITFDKNNKTSYSNVIIAK